LDKYLLTDGEQVDKYLHNEIDLGTVWRSMRHMWFFNLHGRSLLRDGHQVVDEVVLPDRSQTSEIDNDDSTEERL
jgi:hypothetical protein